MRAHFLQGFDIRLTSWLPVVEENEPPRCKADVDDSLAQLSKPRKRGGFKHGVRPALMAKEGRIGAEFEA